MIIKTWEELEEKYRNEERHLMTTEREREFVNDCFECYENEGFNKVFWSPYHGNEKYKGKTFKVLGRTTEKECDLEWQPVWRIQFSDGKTMNAFPEEIIASEMKQFNNCPKEYLNKKENDNMVETWEELKEKEELEKNSLYAQLMLKIHTELFAYKEILYRMTVDEVINEAYKFTMLKEFVKCFEVFSKDYLTNEQFKNLLNVKDNLLEILYNDWINYDSEEQSIYKEFIFGYWNWEELEAN